MGSSPRADDAAREARRGSKRTAKDRALGLLAVRSRSRQELRTRLRRAGFEEQEIERALADLETAGLIDDRRFAAELVRDQAGRRMAGARAIRAALRQKGVGNDLAEEALAHVGQDEEDRAFQLAKARARRLGGLPPEAAYRRVLGLLQRRGYMPAVARRAALRAVSGELPNDFLDPPTGSV